MNSLVKYQALPASLPRHACTGKTFLLLHEDTNSATSAAMTTGTAKPSPDCRRRDERSLVSLKYFVNQNRGIATCTYGTPFQPSVPAVYAPQVGAPVTRSLIKSKNYPLETHMNAWQLDHLGGELTLRDVPMPEERPGSVLGAQLAFDMVGGAADPNATLAALGALRRGGRLVLMGSMTAALPLNYLHLMANNLEILGHFMYPADAYLRLLALLRCGRLDLTAIVPKVFPLTALPAAMEAAAAAPSLECAVVKP
jgi:hypothetical protein